MNEIIVEIIVNLMVIIIYQVIVIDNNGCEDIDEVMVIVNLLFVVDVGDDVIVCLGQFVSFMVFGMNGIVFYIYIWSINVIIVGIIVMLIEMIDYFVIVMDVNGCIDVDMVMVIIDLNQCVSIGDFVWEDFDCDGV